MVTRSLLSLLLLLVPVGVFALPALHIDLNKTDVELGHRINAELFGIDTALDVEQLDLSRLRAGFGVEITDAPAVIEDARWPASKVERLRLRLYPKTTGELLLPAIVAGELATLPVQVTVREGGVNGMPLRFKSELSNTTPWERQQVILWAEVSTPEPFARLTVEAWQPPGFEVVPLPFVREREGERYRIGIGWAIFPLLPGERRLTIPTVDYRLSGGIKRRYHFSDDRLDVKELPPYILPTTPVGRVTLRSSIDPPGILESGALANWRLAIEGDALPPGRLPPVRAQVRSGDGVEFLPEQLVRNSRPDRRGVHGSVAIQYPFKPEGMGRLRLPTLRIDYFDPETGRLETLRHGPETPFVYHRGVVGAVLMLAVIATGWIGLRSCPPLFAGYRRSRARQALLAGMARAESPVELREGLGSLAAIDGWGNNLSLLRWAARWKATYRTDEAFDRLVGQLARACYASGDTPDFYDMRERLLSSIRARKRKP